jgi:hypothetical protein
MLVQASAASCWVVGSSTAAAVPLSLSARRDSDRASRSIAVTAFAEGGSGRSTSSSPMLLIVLCTTSRSRPTEQRVLSAVSGWTVEAVLPKRSVVTARSEAVGLTT